jgi:diadenosine tetraphosphate (Ap4A) HIT family hydrolase
MERILDNKYLKFIPSTVLNFENISKNEKKIDNDDFQKFAATTEISGELIVCNDLSKMNLRSINYTEETYDEYLTLLEKRNPKKDIWIYNIMNGISEQENILYKDELCIVIPTFTWNIKEIDKLHILCLPLNTNLRTIRSLESDNIPLLNHMRNITLKIIKEKYGLNETSIKKFFHYPPSTYHLHIHFVNNHVKFGSSIEYSHELNNVIFNLSICSDYYKKALLNKKI